MARRVRRARLPDLERLFRARGAEFAYLFGSRRSGKAVAGSDWDLAAYFSRRLTKARRGRLRIELLGELCSALGTDRVDPVDLNDAPPLLAFRASSGRPVCGKGSLARVRFDARAMAAYYDRRGADLRSAEAMLRRTAERGL